MDDSTHPQAGIGNTGDNDSINLADYFRVVSKNRRMILKVCAIFVFAMAVISIFLPKMFAASCDAMGWKGGL